MNVEIGAEAAIFPEKEYISGIFVAVSVRNCYDTADLEGKKNFGRKQPCHDRDILSIRVYFRHAGRGGVIPESVMSC
jgi:hypothetical protein